MLGNADHPRRNGIWLQQAKEALLELRPALANVIRNDNLQKLKQIAQADPGLLRRVADMQNQDRQSLTMEVNLRKELDSLQAKAKVLEPNESRLDEKLQWFIDAGLDFIIHVRKQQTAIDTWLMEAIERDRGTVD